MTATMLACRRPSSGWPEYKPNDSKDRLEVVRGQSDDRTGIVWQEFIMEPKYDRTKSLELLDHEDVDHAVHGTTRLRSFR
jgi:hypothetical protein